MKNLEAADPVDPRILAEKTDFQFYLSHEFHRWNEKELFVPGSYDTFLSKNLLKIVLNFFILQFVTSLFHM